jgi:hypothetical protein
MYVRDCHKLTKVIESVGRHAKDTTSVENPSSTSSARLKIRLIKQTSITISFVLRHLKRYQLRCGHPTAQQASSFLQLKKPSCKRPSNVPSMASVSAMFRHCVVRLNGNVTVPDRLHSGYRLAWASNRPTGAAGDRTWCGPWFRPACCAGRGDTASAGVASVAVARTPTCAVRGNCQ